MNDLKSIAANRGKRYAIVIDIENEGAWQVYDLGGAVVYDVESNEVIGITANEGIIETYIYEE